MSLFDRNVRMAVLGLRNRRLMDDQENIPEGRIIDNLSYSRADGDAMNDREEDFGYKQGETAEESGDAVRGGAAAGKPMAKSKREQEEEQVRKIKRKSRKSKREQEQVKRFEGRHGEVDDIDLPPEKPDAIADSETRAPSREEVAAEEEEAISAEGGARCVGAGKSKRQRRNDLVKRLMKKHGISLPQASKMIKEKGMSY